MNGFVEFSKALKRLRTAKGVSSRELSNRIGKASSYVSQVERGLIKNPDFETCFQLLTNLGFQEGQAEEWLYDMGILSPERHQAEIQSQLEHFEESQENLLDSLVENRQEELTRRLHRHNDRLHRLLSQFINQDLQRAEKVIENLSQLTTNKDDFDFLCRIFQRNLSHISDKARQEILETIHKIYESDIDEQFGHMSQFPIEREDDN